MLIYYTNSRNTSASDIDVGLYCLNNDESKPNHVNDFSVLFPIRHVANGLSIIFSPDATLANAQMALNNEGKLPRSEHAVTLYSRVVG